MRNCPTISRPHRLLQIAILTTLCGLAILLMGREGMSAYNNLGEAFICDMSPNAKIELFRGEQAAQSIGEALGTRLYADDRIVLYAGWADVCALYSGQRHRLGPILVGTPPIAYTVKRDALPSANSRFREMLLALFEMLQPPQEAEPKELITKGPGEASRERVFHPAYCKANRNDRLFVAWDLDLKSPELVLKWEGGKQRTKDLVDDTAAKQYAFPYDIQELLGKSGTELETDKLLKVEWVLKDTQTNLQVSGLLEISGQPRQEPTAKDAVEILDPGLRGIEQVIWLFQQNYCLAARSYFSNLKLDSNVSSRLLNNLGRRMGYYPVSEVQR